MDESIGMLFNLSVTFGLIVLDIDLGYGFI